MKYTFISDLFEKPCPGWAGDLQYNGQWVESNPGLALDAIGHCFENADYFINVTDPQRYAKGLLCIFSNSCSNLAFLFTKTNVGCPQKARVLSKLKFVFDNLFVKYCEREVREIGSSNDRDLGFICYMLWDITPIYPTNIDSDVLEECVKIMKYSMSLDNESCIISGLHGNGHWIDDLPSLAMKIDSCKMEKWSPKIKEYAERAKQGGVQ